MKRRQKYYFLDYTEKVSITNMGILLRILNQKSIFLKMYNALTK